MQKCNICWARLALAVRCYQRVRINTRAPFCSGPNGKNCKNTQQRRALFLIIVLSVVRPLRKPGQQKRMSWCVIRRQIVQTVPDSCRQTVARLT